MKKYLLLFAVMTAFAAPSNAQDQWSIGFRTGSEPSKTVSTNGKRTGVLFHQQLFITKKLIKNLEIEFNTAYKGNITQSLNQGGWDDGPQVWIINSSYNILEYGLAAKYYAYNKNGWACYGLFGLNAATTFMTSSSLIKDYGDAMPVTRETKDNYTDIPNELYGGIGLNKTIARHWKLNAQCAVMYNYSGRNYSYFITNDFSPKIQLGIVYGWQ